MKSVVLGLIVSLGGCAGVYAELAATQLSSAKISPSGDGDSTDLGGASTVGFNIGADFGSTRHRFAIGYASDSVSFDNGSGSFGRSSMRYDFNVLSLADRLKLRLALAVELGSGTATYGGMTVDGGGAGAMAGVGATYFLTWSNSIHAMVGARGMYNTAPGGNFTGTGVTARIAIAHTFGDTRPDQTILIPLSFSNDVTGMIAAGAAALGCTITDRHTERTYAWLGVRCSGGRNIRYVQMASGMAITCQHEQSTKNCRALNDAILEAAAPKTTVPEPAVATPAPIVTPAPTPEAAPTPVPAAAPMAAPTEPAPSVAPPAPPAP
ncbi:MAG: hypothetical protein JWP01_699 [Myxococcales bacterium]|nr:hypothetical protein [Myxococcales bacterium]